MPGTSGTKYNDPIYLQRAQLLDSKWGPYNSPEEAQNAFPEAYRCIGLFQIINTPTGAKLYWYKNNTTDLVPFTGNSSVEVYDTFGDFPPVADASEDVIYIAKDTATSYYFNSKTDVYVPFEGESSVAVYPSRPNFPEPVGLINIIYIADDTNISYIWNPELLSGAGDYEVITGVGKSILTIERTSGDGSPGTTDTYTITYSDGTTYDFSIYNGDDGLDGDKYSTTTSSVSSIQTSGTLILTTNDLNLDYIPAQEVIISLDSSTYMIGLVDSYDKTTGVMFVTITSGTGTASGFIWYVNLNGAISIKGDTGDQGAQGEIGFPGFLYDNRRISANQYTVGEIIYYSGQYYICIANNDAIVPVGGAIGVYWNPYSFEGDTGNGIDNISWTSSTGGATPGIPGATDTYTVTYTDTTSDTFVVYNGADGNDVGGTQDLQEVLTEGNTATDINIELVGTSKIQFDNTSKLQKGTTDSGIGGNGGIALKCSIEYELKWEAGRLYIMQQDGVGIREVRYTLTVSPTVNDDDTKGFAVGSRWILDDGETWVCSDNSTGAAVWNIEAAGGGISYYVAGGVADAYTVGAITTYNIGDTYLIKFEEANTGISTLNGYNLVNSKTNNSDLVSGDIRINETHLVVFDADDLFQVLTIGPNSSLNPGGGGGGSGAIVDMGDRLDGLELVDMGSRI